MWPQSIKSPQTKKIIYISIGIFLLSVAAYIYFTLTMKAHFDMFTPDSFTSANMHVIKRRVLHYAKENNKLPNSIGELPELEGFINKDTDGWGHVINMQIKGTEVTLTSFGKDNKLGGVKANLDLIAIFDAKTESGEWADEDNDGHPSWKQRPIIRWDKSEFE